MTITQIDWRNLKCDLEKVWGSKNVFVLWDVLIFPSTLPRGLRCITLSTPGGLNLNVWIAEEIILTAPGTYRTKNVLFLKKNWYKLYKSVLGYLTKPLDCCSAIWLQFWLKLLALPRGCTIYIKGSEDEETQGNSCPWWEKFIKTDFFEGWFSRNSHLSVVTFWCICQESSNFR